MDKVVFDGGKVVYQYFKDTNFKQITTESQESKTESKLFINTSKIQILSKDTIPLSV